MVVAQVLSSYYLQLQLTANGLENSAFLVFDKTQKHYRKLAFKQYK